MLRLNLSNEPRWLELGHGVRLLVEPLTTAIMLVARSDPAIVVSHPSMRMIVDMSDFEANQSVIPTGQSGHPYHLHYDDQMPLWLNGQYHTMLWSRDVVEAAAVDTLILQPGD